MITSDDRQTCSAWRGRQLQLLRQGLEEYGDVRGLYVPLGAARVLRSASTARAVSSNVLRLRPAYGRYDDRRRPLMMTRRRAPARLGAEVRGLAQWVPAACLAHGRHAWQRPSIVANAASPSRRCRRRGARPRTGAWRLASMVVRTRITFRLGSPLAELDQHVIFTLARRRRPTKAEGSHASASDVPLGFWLTFSTQPKQADRRVGGLKVIPDPLMRCGVVSTYPLKRAPRPCS